MLKVMGKITIVWENNNSIVCLHRTFSHAMVIFPDYTRTFYPKFIQKKQLEILGPSDQLTVPP